MEDISLCTNTQENSQEFTSNNSTALSDLATQTVSKSLIMTVTALSIAISSLAFQLSHCRRNSKVAPVDQHILCDPSTVLILVCPTGRAATWNYLVHASVSPFLIEISRKGSHFRESSICGQGRQNGRQDQRSRPGRCRSFHTYPCKTLFPAIRLVRQESDITFL
ncbi:hypothetical protein AVEN_168525-1 [Araneus ventricosus]|uniref:Uncharacterized protein n=1 Tax=Araneus ventricosus TaxID=182803 RepID=A0A4Y2C203_ARAVE|nr:hypothetical protein AVEN_168525-1 [Araneus ventricosus]